ncbi:carboxylesterase/lipase family protein [Amycolatopsis sp. cmx-11-51]|uniref:carboxylesterase/lipase family protein n=1 Tax=unclassified Amycolatopsis TaxID=2618356 RepID=UPI0039E3584D
MTRALRSLLIATSLVASLGSAVPAAAEPAGGSPDSAIVRTGSGAVRGVVAKDHRTFQGIPYAAPPVGPLRWAPPQPVTPWNTPRDASRPGNTCAQNDGLLGEKRSESEDCLYLNVTTPRRTSGRKLPVMVWIHGSGFAHGSGSMYQARDLAVDGAVVVVTINYRLGLFGFLAHPALDTARPSGNFGLQDQQEAMRWVRRNAAAFGGDGNNVTIFGESAGGISTCAHLVSPGSAGLFHRTIIQSGPCTGTWTDASGNWLPRSRQEARQHSAAVAGQLGCPDPTTAAACLRGKSTKELLPQSNYGWGPVYGGGGELPLSPQQALSTGRFNHVPVMNGMTRDEHRMFVAGSELLGRPPLTDAAYRTEIETIFGTDKAPGILARYPSNHYASPSLALSAAVTDGIWAHSAGQVSRLLARQVPTYTYEFADEHTPWVTTLPPPSFPTGAYHAAELQYLFDADYFGGQLTRNQKHLSATIIRYWTQFARTGNPNSPHTPYWPQDHNTGDDAQSLAPGPRGIKQTAFDREHQADFWRSLDQR